MRKKVVFAGIAIAGSVNASNAENLILIPPGKSFAISVDSLNPEKLEWVRQFANANSFSVESGRKYTLEPLASNETATQLALALSEVLGPEVAVKIVIPEEVQLATQGGGRPGRDGL